MVIRINAKVFVRQSLVKYIALHEKVTENLDAFQVARTIGAVDEAFAAETMKKVPENMKRSWDQFAAFQRRAEQGDYSDDALDHLCSALGLMRVAEAYSSPESWRMEYAA